MGFPEISAMKASGVHQALDHRRKKSAGSTCWLKCLHPDQIAISPITDKIKDQVDNPTPGEDLAMLLGALWNLDCCGANCHGFGD